MAEKTTPRAGAPHIDEMERQMRQGIAEIIEELEQHVEKFGGEEVTKNFGTRDILTALKAVDVELTGGDYHRCGDIELPTPEEVRAWEPGSDGLDPYYNRLYRAYLALWGEWEGERHLTDTLVSERDRLIDAGVEVPPLVEELQAYMKLRAAQKADACELVAAQRLLQQRVTELENEVQGYRAFRYLVDEALNSVSDD